jgi:hypothetical protein
MTNSTERRLRSAALLCPLPFQVQPAAVNLVTHQTLNQQQQQFLSSVAEVDFYAHLCPGMEDNRARSLPAHQRLLLPLLSLLLLVLQELVFFLTRIKDGASVLSFNPSLAAAFTDKEKSRVRVPNPRATTTVHPSLRRHSPMKEKSRVRSHNPA